MWCTFIVQWFLIMIFIEGPCQEDSSSIQWVLPTDHDRTGVLQQATVTLPQEKDTTISSDVTQHSNITTTPQQQYDILQPTATILFTTATVLHTAATTTAIIQQQQIWTKQYDGSRNVSTSFTSGIWILPYNTQLLDRNWKCNPELFTSYFLL